MSQKADSEETIDCRKLVLATGYFGQPNRLGVPGEDLPGVSHTYDEGHASFERDVVVVGGGNSAVEAALDLYRCGARVTLVHRRERVKETVKYWIRPDVENRILEGAIRDRPESEVMEILPGRVRIRRRQSSPAGHGPDKASSPGSPGGSSEELLPWDRLYLLIGFHPDFDLFRRLGIELDEDDRPKVDPETLETNVRGLYMAGSIVHGRRVSQVFIENGRFDGEKIFAAG